MPCERPPAATLQASGSAWSAIRRAFLQIATHADPKSAIDDCIPRQPHSPKARWISYASTGFWQACEDVGVDRVYLVAAVREGYAFAENVDVLPVHELGKSLA